MTQTPQATGSTDRSSRGLAARVSLGRVFAPLSTEFLLILSAALLLTVFGLVMVLSASSANSIRGGEGPYGTVMRQALIAVVGLPLMFIASRLPIRFWKRIAWAALIVSIFLQLLVFVPGLGVENDGNQNWIRVGGQNLQPSEFLKVTLALWIGYVLYRKQALLRLWKHVFIPVIPVFALVAGTVLMGHDLGTAMVLFLILLGGLYFSGIQLRIFILPIVASVLVVGALVVTSSRRMSQIASLFSPDATGCYFDDCYQQLHAVWGMASGGIFGLGLGNSREKYGGLPAAENDYIFAIVGEELGLLGCAVVLGLFAVLAIGAIRVIRRSDDAFVRIVTGGILTWIIGQALINVGVVLRIFPVLGVPLPFMSQGGTSLLSVLIATGILLACARTIPADAPARTAGRARQGKVSR